MARTKRKTNPVIPAAEAPAQAQKQYRAAAYARLSVEDSGKPGADTIEGQKALLTSFIESSSDMELVALFCDNGRTGTDFDRPQFEKMMEAVKRGGDRQQLHERVRVHSMAATARMKDGEPCDLLDRLAGDPAFGMTRPELDRLMDPARYIGRCPQQVRALLDRIAPLLEGASSADGGVSL